MSDKHYGFLMLCPACGKEWFVINPRQKPSPCDCGEMIYPENHDPRKKKEEAA